MTATKPKKLPPIHPGVTLLDDFMKPLGLNANRLAIDLRVPAQQISEIVKGQRGISASTALRLARYFDTSAEFWMNLQSHYELQVASDEAGKKIERGITPAKEVVAAGG